MNDIIYRQQAIDEIKEIYEWHDNVTKERIIEHFERLPSAQAERMCNGCRYERHGSVVCDSCSRFFLDRYEADNNG